MAMSRCLFDAMTVEAMAFGRFALAGGAEAVGEYLAVIGEDRLDGERGVLDQTMQNIADVGGRFLRQDVDIDPT